MNVSNEDILNEVLSSSVSSITEGTSAAAAVKKAKYHELSRVGNLTSYSMQQVAKRCMREFQLMKLSADCNGNSEEKESNVTFAFGHAVGAAVAVYDKTHDRAQAIWAAFLSWDIDLFEEEPVQQYRPDKKKAFHHAVWALYQYEEFYSSETDLGEYEVVKNEATVVVDFQNGHYYVGHVDELLRHKELGHFKIKENKTTGYGSIDPAMYENSDQALSYSVIISAEGETDYAVHYCIYSSTEQRWLQFEFIKSALDKANWLQGQIYLQAGIDLASDLNFFPKNGDACVRYGRRCQYFGSCDQDLERTFGKKFSDLPRIVDASDIGRIETIDYSFTWDQLVASQKESL